jgi:hypothetical protein
MIRPPYRPTRQCPHRWCNRLHLSLAGLGVVIIAQTMFTGLMSVLFMAAIVAIAVGVGRLISGKSLMRQAMDEAVEAAVGIHLVVRRGWALAAVGCDGFYVLNGGLSIGYLFAHPHTSSVPESSTAGYIAVGVVIGLLAFSQFAHRQATRPAKPKRVLIPALTATR